MRKSFLSFTACLTKLHGLLFRFILLRSSESILIWCSCGTKAEIFELSRATGNSRPYLFYQEHLGLETGLISTRFRFRKWRARIRNQWLPLVVRDCAIIIRRGAEKLEFIIWQKLRQYPPPKQKNSSNPPPPSVMLKITSHPSHPRFRQSIC